MDGEEQQASYLDNLQYVALAAQGNSTNTTMLNSIYGKLSHFLVRANAHAFISEARTMDLLEG